MSDKSDVSELKLREEEVFSTSRLNHDFTTYLSPLLNLANRFSHATRPKHTGPVQEDIQRSEARTVEEWEDWHRDEYPTAVEDATDKVWEKTQEMKQALDDATREEVRVWIERLYFDQSFKGIIRQNSILHTLSDEFDAEMRFSTPEEEAKHIDGYIGQTPVSVKPTSYDDTQDSLPEAIDIALVTYEETGTFLKIHYDESDFSSSESSQ